MRNLRTRLLALSLAAASITCGDDLAAPDPRPAALVQVAGEGQVGLINQPLPEPLVVRVDDAQGQPLAGVAVVWTVTGDGSVSQSSVISGSDGRAAVQRMLGATAGPQTTTARVPSLPPVLFTATAEAGSLPQLVMVTQPSSAAENAVPLAQQPVVRVEDGSGQPLGAGIPVTVSVSGATLAGATTVESDAAGTATFTGLALSGPAGNYSLTFTAPNLVPVQSAAITLGTATGTRRLVIATQPSETAESAVPLVRQPVVRVEDEAGQPLGAGIPVTVSAAGATLAGTLTVESNGSGVAGFTDLALIGSGGTYTLTFSAPNAAPVQSGAITLASTSAQGGRWSEPFSWPIVAVHVMLLPSGRILAFGRTREPQVWDPATNVFTPFPAPARLFCSGHSLLSDGRVLTVGGHISDRHGLPNTTLFSETSAWTSSTAMVRGRWYPTATTMGNGDVVITGGTDESAANVPIPEVWSNGSLRQLTGASQSLPWYPRAFLAPDGDLFVAGPTVQTRFLSVTGAGSWRAGPRHLHPEGRTYGGAVMYDDGKILYAGGGLTTNTAEVIDLNQPNPIWSWTSPMAFARRHLNLTVLPTGEVLATGGVAGTTFNDVSKPVRAAELWDPQTGQWTTLASNAITRGYHGTSLLLPDGRVLNAGSGEGGGGRDEFNAEFFTPPYLLRGPRPVITSAPAEIRYGDQFRVVTPQAAGITKVSFIRLGAVTHAFDENQRFQRLSFTADATGLSVMAPTSANRTPPGHYMVFILNGNDVPSVAKIVRIF
jgi:hypothetical protein